MVNAECSNQCPQGEIMGMRISGASNAWASQQNNAVSNWQQRHQNFKSLKTALESNDLTGAQQAFAALAASNPNATANANSPLAQLGQALQAGNMPAAQQVAQAWKSSQQSEQAGTTPSANDANAAVSSFLQALSASTTPSSPLQGNASDTTTPNGSAVTSTATTPQQVEQALLAFEKNLFDSLKLQQSSASSTSATTAANVTASADSSASLLSTATQPTNVASSPTGHHHHHHHSGQGGSQMSAELASLIGQTQQGSTGTSASDPTNAAAGSVAGLDQSFKSLLNTLGVSGNNASLNSFLQTMSSSMSASASTSA